MKKILYILRGVSGCGKTTTANSMVGEENVCSADEFFYIKGNGKYAFDANLLGAAHKFCVDKVIRLIAEGVEKIAVANTSTNERDVNIYRKIAEENGYISIVLTVENWHGGKDTHDVPEEALERMEKQLKNSIKLK
jgi:predicted kinase